MYWRHFNYNFFLHIEEILVFGLHLLFVVNNAMVILFSVVITESLQVGIKILSCFIRVIIGHLLFLFIGDPCNCLVQRIKQGNCCMQIFTAVIFLVS